jgi:hypothetical protein
MAVPPVALPFNPNFSLSRNKTLDYLDVSYANIATDDGTDPVNIATGGDRALTIGNATMTNPIEVQAVVDMNSNQITGLPTCTQNTEAANKLYVDSVAAGLRPKESCKVGTTADLNCSYSAATLTLTENAPGTLLTIDGVAPALTDRVLVKDQAVTTQNGIYVVVNVGGVGTQYELTRSSDYDDSPGSEIGVGDSTYVLNGTLNGGLTFVMINENFVTLDVSPIIWTEKAHPSPLTTKGDLYTYSTESTRLPVGTPGQALIVDAAEPTGLKWVDPTFLILTDTPATYTTPSSIYAVNAGGTAVQETGTQLVDAGANNFTLTRGTTVFDCQNDLTVTNACTIDQNLQTTAAPTFTGLTRNYDSVGNTRASDYIIYLRTTNEWLYICSVQINYDTGVIMKVESLEGNSIPVKIKFQFEFTDPIDYTFRTFDLDTNPHSIVRPRVAAWSDGADMHLFIRATDGGVDGNPHMINLRYISRYHFQADHFGVSEGTGANPDGTTSGWNVGWTLKFDSQSASYPPTGRSNLGSTHVYDTTASTSVSTGALIVDGGIGVAGALSTGTHAQMTNIATPANALAGTVRLYSEGGLLKTVDESGTVRQITNVTAGNSAVLANTFSSQAIGAGTFWVDGYYNAPAGAVNANAGPHTLGLANVAYGAHAFIVSSGAITGTGVTVTVSGTSWTDATATRTPGDSEVLTSSFETSVLNQYIEGPKKWLGQVTFTITGAAPSGLFNIGFAKYQDLGNIQFDVAFAEVTGLADANDTSFNCELLHHQATGWAYSELAFSPGSSPVLVDFAALYGAESNLASGVEFAFKREGAIATGIRGDLSEGIIWRVTTGSANSIQIMNIKCGVFTS